MPTPNQSRDFPLDVNIIQKEFIGISLNSRLHSFLLSISSYSKLESAGIEPLTSLVNEGVRDEMLFFLRRAAVEH